MALSREFAAAILLLLAACAAPAEPQSPSYEAGFADGCATAAAQIGSIPRTPKRDQALYAEDSGYRLGWLSGHAACRMPDGRAGL